MATKKKLLQAAAGAGGAEPGLNVEQVFSTYLYEGNGSEQTINNGIELGDAKGFGGFSFSQSSDYFKISSLIQLIADFTLEAYIYSDSTFTNQNQILGSDLSIDANRQVYIDNSTKYLRMYDGSVLASTSAVPQDQWCHIAITRSGSTITFYIDGVSSGTATSNATFEIRIIGGLVTGAGVNEDFKGKISNLRIVTGSVLYTSDFTPPSTNLTNVSGTQLLTAQGASPQTDNSSNSYTISGFNTPSTYTTANTSGGGEGGLVWIKNRVGANSHKLFDTERGALYKLHTDETIASTQETDTLSSFNANGFSVLSDNAVNGSTAELASWTFRKAPKFFDVVTYTGNGTAGRTISHNLGTTVGCIIVKRTSSAQNWAVYHRGNTAAPETDVLYLNLTDATTDLGSVWYDTAPTSTEFTLGDQIGVNANGETYVAYLFAHNDGDGDFGPDGDADIIKCGTFTEVSGSDVTVDLGFEPQWIMIKVTSTTGGWGMYDVMRGWTSGSDDFALTANTSDAESNVGDRWLVNSNGFTWKNTGNARDIIYIAIRRGPMAVPTAATDVFAAQATRDATDGTSSTNAFTSGFPLDFIIQGARGSGVGNYAGDRLRGNNYLQTNDTAAETSWVAAFDSMDGLPFTVSLSANSSYCGWMWKRAPSFFDVVAYTGNGTAGRTVSHNLGVAPEMMWVKSRTEVKDWIVYHKDLTDNTKYIVLNSASGEDTATTAWNSTSPTETVFTVGTATSVNNSNQDFIAYLFASLDGVSKVGSFTGNGSTQDIDCGFSSGARFVLIKKTNSVSNWFLWDSERGIVAGDDPVLQLNITSAEVTGYDWLDPLSSGFTLNAVNPINQSGDTYIFYAVSA